MWPLRSTWLPNAKERRHEDQHPDTIEQITGQVRSMFYLVDEATTILTIQLDGQTITARASGQLALDLRALPRGATICATLHNAQLEGRKLSRSLSCPHAWASYKPKPTR